MLENKLSKVDSKLINFTRLYSLPFARFSVFLVYFWFGILKVFSQSPATPLVEALFVNTISIISFENFLISFGIFEMLIGVIFLVPRLERIAILLLVVHLITTIMPLFILPAITWHSFLIPTLEGQYIIKNILLVALVLVIGGHLHSLKFKNE